MPADEPLISRWSRRKQQQREQTEAAEAAAGEPPAEAEGAAAGETPPELPDIDNLDKDSDFTAFMQEGVPEDLRSRALRKLWLSDPMFAEIDGLDDYDEDVGAILKAGAKAMRKLAEAAKRESAGPESAAGDPAEEAAAVGADEVATRGDGAAQSVATEGEADGREASPTPTDGDAGDDPEGTARG